ncbi:hypothetical protein K7X08_037096 [Anisodus acutangulus]|uniref:Dirigent protein n=1 Tax=Anisodus acutangulus TaxID=402998 RepID=A0A9Q1QWY3_9SOLA|nr:hypothetical protein K7X08_037096 [Anisodus acutangulus]
MPSMGRVTLFIILLTWETEGQDTESWAKRVETGKEVVTTLQFYLHDKLSGSNPSAVRVAQADGTNSSVTLFGALMTMDDPLTIGPDPTSKLVGRARGLYGSTSQTDLIFIMEMLEEFGHDIFLAAEATNGIGDTELKALRNLSRLTREGYVKLMKKYKLDALVTAGPGVAAVLAIGGFPAISVPIGICFSGLKGSEK